MQEEQHYFAPFEEKKLPTMLKVLTILTFVGSGLALLFYPFYSFYLKFMIGLMNSQIEAFGKVGSNTVSVFNESKITYEKLLKVAIPVSIVSIIASICCIVGAVKMRSFKLWGYWLYIVASILGTAITITLNYGAAPPKWYTIPVAIFFPLLFIVLYTTQKKHLK